MIPVMPNKGLEIELQPSERTQLEQWESAHGTPQQVALRFRIILRAVAGEQNVGIAEGLGASGPTGQMWRKRGDKPSIREVWEGVARPASREHNTQGQTDQI